MSRHLVLIVLTVGIFFEPLVTVSKITFKADNMAAPATTKYHFQTVEEVKDHVQSGLEPDVHQEGGQIPSDISQDVDDTISLDDDDEGMVEEAVEAWLSELDDD